MECLAGCNVAEFWSCALPQWNRKLQTKDFIVPVDVASGLAKWSMCLFMWRTPRLLAWLGGKRQPHHRSGLSSVWTFAVAQRLYVEWTIFTLDIFTSCLERNGGKHSLDSLEWTSGSYPHLYSSIFKSSRGCCAFVLNELRHLERVRIGILDFFAWQFCAVSCKAKVLWCIWLWLSDWVVTILCYEEVVCQCMPYVLCSKQKLRQMGGAFEGFVLGPLFFIALLKCAV